MEYTIDNVLAYKILNFCSNEGLCFERSPNPKPYEVVSLFHIIYRTTRADINEIENFIARFDATEEKDRIDVWISSHFINDKKVGWKKRKLWHVNNFCALLKANFPEIIFDFKYDTGRNYYNIELSSKFMKTYKEDFEIKIKNSFKYKFKSFYESANS